MKSVKICYVASIFMYINHITSTVKNAVNNTELQLWQNLSESQVSRALRIHLAN